MRVARKIAWGSVFLIAACGGPGSGLTGIIGGGNGGGGGGGGGTPNPASAAVEVVNFAFRPASVTIRPGGSVTWNWNSDTTSHNVTFDDGIQNGGTRNSGSHTRFFTAAGTFPYHCTLHSSMTGSVRVQ